QPDLEPARTRHHWLAEALARSRLSGPAAELYRRELGADPEAALTGPYRDPLAVGAEAGEALARGRWRLAVAVRNQTGRPAAADVAPAAAAVAEDPAASLHRFDRFVRSRGPAVLAALTRAFDAVLRDREGYAPGLPPDLVRGLAGHLPGGWQRGYDQLRADL